MKANPENMELLLALYHTRFGKKERPNTPKDGRKEDLKPWLHASKLRKVGM